MKRRTLYFAGVLLVLLLFPYGPLFPWSPVKPGYEHLALERADVYFPSGTTLDPAYRRIDEYIAKSEQFHGLKAPKRICVVACGDWSSFRRFLPHMRGTGVGAVTLATGTAIYMSPHLAERRLDANEFLRHEISHATLHQNQSLANALRIIKVEWVSEGLAVAYGDQKSYYVVWRRFNEFLMATRGREAYQRYLEAVLQDPEAWRELFPQHLGLSFAEAVEEFQGAMRKLPG